MLLYLDASFSEERIFLLCYGSNSTETDAYQRTSTATMLCAPCWRPLLSSAVAVQIVESSSGGPLLILGLV